MYQETATRRSHVFSPDHSGNIVVPSASHDVHAAPNSSNNNKKNGSHQGMNGGDRGALTPPPPPRRAVPGRARKRRGTGTKRKSKSSSFWRRCYLRCWCKDLVQSFSSLFLAVLLWYSLGVISIGSSKLLLSGRSGEDRSFGRVDPLFLTLQQLLIGSTLLRFLLKIHFLDSPGVQPLVSSPPPSSQRRRGIQLSTLVSTVQSYPPHLILSGLYFSLGFLATNYGFSGAPASFVETIKAAEPITSATVAVWWGIEILSSKEVTSLATIVCGVLLSTLGNRQHHSADNGVEASTGSSLSETTKACLIIMASNLCFSFRGLYQKLFRATGVGRVIDDVNLQFRMQQMGVILLMLPALIWNVPSALFQIWAIYAKHGFSANGIVLKYLGLSLINGCAFTSYNLASTYILTRISVVHHAALNCIRRIFAIVVTSIAFNVPITITGSLGILLSLFGFMSFTHFKVQRQRTPKPVSSLLPVSAVK